MSIFRKKTTNGSIRNSTIGGPESLTSREALTSPHPNARSAGIPRPERRLPKEAIGINRLLNTYDEFAHLQQVVASTENELAIERERAEVAEDEKAGLERELKEEREGRKAEGIKAGKDLKTAEAEREKKIRGVLEPKVKDLEEKLKKVELERDGYKKEVNEKTLGMNRWISAMEKLHKEREAADSKERTAAEERKKLDTKLKELDGEILTGMKGWAKAKEEALAVDEKKDSEVVKEEVKA